MVAASNAEPTTVDKLQALPWSIAANATNTVFVQFTFFGPAFVLFLSELEISKTQIGFLLSMFPFMGLVALFNASWVAKYGYKRTYLTFWTSRNLITALLLLVPFVQAEFSQQAAIALITAVVMGFGLCRAIGETGYYPWVQEFVPDSIRGKYSATNNVFGSLVGVIAVVAASFVLDQSEDINRFMILFALGVAFGLTAVWMYTHVPGGAPVRKRDEARVRLSDMRAALKDRNLTLFLGGIALLAFGSSPIYSFLPIFMQEQVGLAESNIILLQTATLIGGLISTYLLGWSADRYGSKPVMMSGVVIKIFLPIAWILMPRHSSTSLPVALIIAFVTGIANFAWVIGSGRLLFVNIVPTKHKGPYMSVYYAVIGIIGGSSQLLGGRLLDAFSGISGEFMGITLDPFTPLMVAGVILPIASLYTFRRIKASGELGLTQFAGMFIRGNPFFALESMVRYYRARDEKATIQLTERLGQTHSPLTVEELLEALEDPRFNVRFEAVISIARTKPHPRLTRALGEVVNGTELSLTTVAIWALGRLGDPEAIPYLRTGLDSEYRSIRAHSARALGTIGDRESIDILQQRLKVEEDKGLQMAYAYALGNLQATDSIDYIFAILEETSNSGARLELALSLARMIGTEHHFVRLLRQVRSDPGTAIAQEVVHFSNNALKQLGGDEELVQVLGTCSDAFAHEDLQTGITLLAEVIKTLPETYFRQPAWQILQHAAQHLVDNNTEQHIEYLILILHALQEGIVAE